jgi:tetratricopeptide (TPR) repeat protein
VWTNGEKFLALAQTDHNLGIAHRDLGLLGEADRHYRNALRRARQLGDQRLAAMARIGRAEIWHRRDEVYAGAEARHALEAFAEVGDELGRSDALRLLGNVALARSDWDEAGRCFARALDLARENANPLLEAEILEERAELHAKTGQTALASADTEVATAIYRRLGARSGSDGPKRSSRRWIKRRRSPMSVPEVDQSTRTAGGEACNVLQTKRLL